ncbi:cyclase family protein [Halococcoides cellulosivorans]|uniref:cyclase family protein n=1 Tax=Halococcoides cellulosivorans TaxID=1679096 RepID=UPI00157491BA|nr:cyclase family protein [Halococcoides cellulosivorans]
MHDLSHPVVDGMPTYPGDPPVSTDAVATHATDGYRLARLSCGTHAGTHIDAPAHILPDGRTLDEFDVSAFVRVCRRVDCRDLGPRAAITADRLPDLDALDDAVDCLAVWTGWDTHWGTPAYRDHPHLVPAAAERIADAGLAVALDTAGPDPTPPVDGAPADTASVADASSETTADGDANWPAHRAILGAGEPIVENLRNLGAVGTTFELRALPLRLDGGGSPVRAVGVER